MEGLKTGGVVVHLRLELDALRDRLTDLDTRGVVMARGETLEMLFDERQPLYEKYADVVVECAGLRHEQVVSRICAAVGE
jgi:shikimate kinase